MGAPDSAASAATPSGGLAARASWSVRRDNDRTAGGQAGEQGAKCLGTAFVARLFAGTANRGAAVDGADGETRQDGADETAVTMAADQDGALALRVCAPEFGPAGGHQRQAFVPEGDDHRHVLAEGIEMLAAFNMPAGAAQG